MKSIKILLAAALVFGCMQFAKAADVVEGFAVIMQPRLPPPPPRPPDPLHLFHRRPVHHYHRRYYHHRATIHVRLPPPPPHP